MGRHQHVSSALVGLTRSYLWAGAVDSLFLQVALVLLGGLVPVSPQLLCWRSLPHFWWVPAPLALLQSAALSWNAADVLGGTIYRQALGSVLLYVCQYHA